MIKNETNFEFPEQASASIYNLRNKASKMTTMQIDNKIDQQQDSVHEDPRNYQTVHEAEGDSVQDDKVQEANGLINETDNEQGLRTVISVEDEELENTFKQILPDLEPCTM